MDSLATEYISTAFKLGFDFGTKWFTVYLVVVIGVFIYKLIGRL